MVEEEGRSEEIRGAKIAGGEFERAGGKGMVIKNVNGIVS